MKAKKVFKEMIKNKQNMKTFDPWVESETKQFEALKVVSGHIKYKDNFIYVKHESGSGCGMGENPPTVTVIILHSFE